MKTKGSRNKNRKKVLTGGGYYELFEPSHPIAKRNGYVLEHRMMAYDAGMLTDLRMEVHHKNKIKTDNRLENFEILTKQKHTSITWTGVKRSDSGIPCNVCGIKTRSKYKLCARHYKSEWQRNRIYQSPELIKP